MERDAIREEFWAAFDAFVPGTADPEMASAAVQKSEDRIVEPAVADRDD
jgi:lysophospholipase